MDEPVTDPFADDFDRVIGAARAADPSFGAADPITADVWETINQTTEEDEEIRRDLMLFAGLDPILPVADNLPMLAEHEPVEHRAEVATDRHVAARRAIQRAHSVHSLLAADLKKDYDEMSLPLSVMGHIQPGQEAFIRYSIRALPDFRQEAKDYIGAVMTGTVEEKSKAVWRKGLRWMFFGSHYFLARAFEGSQTFGQVPLKPGSEIQIRPMKDLDEDEKAALKSAQAKAGEVAHFEVTLYVGVVGPKEDRAALEALADEICSTITNTFETPIQSLAWEKALPIDAATGFMGRKPSKPPRRVVLSVEELAVLAAPPDDTTTPSGIQVKRCESREIQPKRPRIIDDPLNPPKGLIPVGIVNRGSSKEMTVGISNAKLNQHCFYAGGTGSGKSVMMERLTFGIAKDDYPIVVIDPHGQLSDNLLDSMIRHCPERLNDLVFCDLGDSQFPVAINPLDIHNQRAIDSQLNALREMLANDAQLNPQSAPRAITIATAGFAALMEANLKIQDPAKKATMLDLVDFLQDDEFRNLVVQLAERSMVRQWFAPEKGTYEAQEKQQSDIAMPVIRAMQTLAWSDSFGAVFSSPENKLDFAKMVKGKKIVLLKLARFTDEKKLGEFVGALVLPWLISSLQTLQGHGCRVLVDEAPTLLKEGSSALVVLAEARKYDLGLIFAAQFLSQLPKSVQEGALENTFTKFAFRNGIQQASVMATAIGNDKHTVTATDIAKQPLYHFYASALTDDGNQDIFSAFALPPLDKDLTADEQVLREGVITSSRQLLSNRRDDIDRIGRTHLDDLKTALRQVIAEEQNRGPATSGDEYGIDWPETTGEKQGL